MDQLKIESMPGRHDGIRILRLSGPFTLQGVMEFQTIFRSGNDPVTIVDLTAVPYMDSAALGAVISVHTTAQTHRRAYALAGVSERLHTLINVAGVGGILVTCPSLEEAEEKFASRAVSS